MSYTLGMAKKRGYGDGCVIASALDLVGERWALLVVRELLLGPKRYTDLQSGLRGIASNVLTQRLHDLEAFGVVRRRKLSPPISAWVYELTEWGYDLRPVLAQLGHWGRRSPFHDRTAQTSVDSLVMALQAHYDAGAGALVGDIYGLRIGDHEFSVTVAEEGLDVARGEAAGARATMTVDADSFSALLTDRLAPEEALSDGRLTVTGDSAAVERLFDSLSSPTPADAPAAA